MLRHLAAACACFVLSAAQRVVVPIDLGWRTTAAQPPPSSCAYTTVYEGMATRLGGSSNNVWPSNQSTTLAACAAAACSSSSSLYAFNGNVSAPNVSSCWLGDRSQMALGGPADAQWTTYALDVTAWPPLDAPESSRSFDDGGWAVVDLPHDASATAPHQREAAGGQGYRRPVGQWYRKHFSIPSAWNASSGVALFLNVEGAVTHSTWWLNGAPLAAAAVFGGTDGAYLPSVFRVDAGAAGAPPLFFGAGAENVLAVWTSNIDRTGWFEEGCGLIRPGAALTAVPAAAFVAPLGVAAPAYVDESGGGVLTPAAAVTAGGAAAAHVVIAWALYDATSVVASANASASIPFNATFTVQGPSMSIPDVAVWNVSNPSLYTLVTNVLVGGALVDAVNTTVGFRSLAWDSEFGLRVNGAPTKMRGFCEHETFGGLGAAIPARVDLLRVQQLRGVGGNAWRTSHNPPEPQLLDLCDRLGVLVDDENRVFASVDNAGYCGAGGCEALPIYAPGSQVANAALLAQRDRNHASVAFYSVCNELGCGPGSLLVGDVGLDVIEAMHASDGGRAVSGNMGWQGPNATKAGTPISQAFDLMGMSHQSPATLQAFHAQEPSKAIVMSECCSCESQRSEDADLLPYKNASAAVFFSSESSACYGSQTQVSNGPAFCAGTFVWTMHDYGGEPDNWPHVSSAFGIFDYAGFPKQTASWFRSWWLSNISLSDPARPPLGPATALTVKLVETWQNSPNGTRVLHVYTNAPFARILVNGLPAAGGAPVAVPPYGDATFFGVPFAPGNVTAQALAADGATVLGEDTAFSWGAPAALLLTVDAPSPRTGTGAAVYMDGADVALVRATVVDAAGRFCEDASSTVVTFAVTAGPAIVVGSTSGNPADQLISVNSRSTYNGLVRAIVRVTIDAAGTASDRLLRAFVNTDAGAGNASSSIYTSDAPPPASSFTVTASAPNLGSASITISLSQDPSDDVLAVAAANVNSADTRAF